MRIRISKKSGLLYFAILVILAAVIIGITQLLQSKKPAITIGITPGQESPWFTIEKLNKKGITPDQVALFDRSVVDYNREWNGKAALMNMGYIYMDAGQYVAAEMAFRRYLEHDSLDSDARLGRARALKADGRTIDAETQYIALLEADPLYMYAFEELLALYESGTLPLNTTFLALVMKARGMDQRGDYTTELNDFTKRYSRLEASL